MSFACTICGNAHEDRRAAAYAAPDSWASLDDGARAKGQLTDDLCRIADGRFYVRGVLELPLAGGGGKAFEFGAWASVSGYDFDRYRLSYDDADQSKLGALSGYLSNEILSFPGAFGVEARTVPRDGGQRPLVVLAESEHPLAVAQRDGISAEQLSRLIHSLSGRLR